MSRITTADPLGGSPRPIRPADPQDRSAHIRGVSQPRREDVAQARVCVPIYAQHPPGERPADVCAVSLSGPPISAIPLDADNRVGVGSDGDTTPERLRPADISSLGPDMAVGEQTEPQDRVVSGIIAVRGAHSNLTMARPHIAQSAPDSRLRDCGVDDEPLDEQSLGPDRPRGHDGACPRRNAAQRQDDVPSLRRGEPSEAPRVDTWRFGNLAVPGKMVSAQYGRLPYCLRHDGRAQGTVGSQEEYLRDRPGVHPGDIGCASHAGILREATRLASYTDVHMRTAACVDAWSVMST